MEKEIQQSISRWCEAYDVRRLIGDQAIIEASVELAALFEREMAEREGRVLYEGYHKATSFREMDGIYWLLLRGVEMDGADINYGQYVHILIREDDIFDEIPPEKLAEFAKDWESEG